MSSFSAWGWALLIFSILMVILYFSIIIYYRKYIPIYSSARVVFLISFIVLIIGIVKTIILLSRDITGNTTLIWPNVHTLLILIGYIGFFGLILIVWIYFGPAWFKRQKYRLFTDWGPYYTFATPDGKIFNEISVYHKQIFVQPRRPKDNRPFLEIPYENQKWLILGDLHGGSNNIKPLIETWQKYHKDANLVLSLGDFVGEGRKWVHWQMAFSQIEKFLHTHPIIVSTGNHDGYTRLGYHRILRLFPQPYIDFHKGAYFYIKIGQNMIIILDNFNASKHYLNFLPDQRVWLEKTLQKADKDQTLKHIFLAMHISPDSLVAEGDYPKFRYEFFDLIHRFPKVKIVFAGHFHAYYARWDKINEISSQKAIEKEIYVNNKILSIITGGGGGKIKLGLSEKYLGLGGGRMSTDPTELELDENGMPKNYLKVRHFLVMKIIGHKIKIEARLWDNSLLHTIEFNN